MNGSFLLKLTHPSFVRVFNSYDIVIITETKLSTRDYLALDHLGFSSVIRNERPTGSGGVLLAINNRISHIVRVVSNVPGSEQIFVSIADSLVVAGVYIPPRNSHHFSSIDRFAVLEEKISNLAIQNFVVCGDFNSRFGERTQHFANLSSFDLESVPIRNDDKIVNQNGREFLSLCSRVDSILLTGKKWSASFTCFQPKGASVVDTAFCSTSALQSITNGKLHPISTLSDHCAISFSCQLDGVAVEEEPEFRRKSVLSKRYVHRILSEPMRLRSLRSDIIQDRDVARFKESVNQYFRSDRMLNKIELTNLFDDFYSSIERVLTKGRAVHRKQRVFKRHTIGVIEVAYDQICIDARRAFFRARRVFKRTRKPTDYAVMTFTRKLKKKHERRCERISQSLYLRELFLPSNSTRLWECIKPPCRVEYRGPITNEEYTDHLASIASGKFPYSLELSDESIRRVVGLNAMPQLNSSLERSLVQEFPLAQLLNTKFRKACGSDGWSGELVRLIGPSICDILPTLFVLILRSGETPAQWDQDIKVPIPKPNKPPRSMSSLRPITLVNILMKQFEEWVISLLDTHCSSSEFQAGFKKGYSCTSRLFVLRTLLDSSIQCRETPIFAIFIDFSSFFDTIHGEILCGLLLDRGVPGYLVKMLYGMLSSVTASVLLKGKMGRQFECKVGLRQGSKASPKLASLYLDEISSVLENLGGGIPLFDRVVNHIFYADDLVLLFSSIESAQQALLVLENTCDKLGLSVSVEKSFCVNFSKKRSKGTRDLFWKNEVLPRVEEAVYLGCSISSKVCFDSQMKRVKIKADKAFSVLYNFQKRYPMLPFNKFLRLYMSLVYPILSYASEVFAWGIADRLDKIFVEHLRRYLSLPKHVSSIAIHWLTGTRPIQYHIWKRAYSFWAEIASLGSHRLESSAYMTNKEYLVGKPSWISEMCSLFDHIGFVVNIQTWTSSEILSHKASFLSCLDTHFESYFHDWTTDCSYRHLVSHHKFGTASFLNQATLFDRKILARFWLRCFHFEVVCGTRHNLVFAERFCESCFKDGSRIVLGDEIHYLLHCPRFVQQRQLLCNTLHITVDELYPIVCNLTCSSFPSPCRAIAKFFQTSFGHLQDPYEQT